MVTSNLRSLRVTQPTGPKAAPTTESSPAGLPVHNFVGRSSLGHEMAYTLRRAQQQASSTQPDDSAPLLRLRAARACWLIGEVQEACHYYRLAAPELVDIADSTGRRTGTANEYLRLALSAAWMPANASTPDKQRQQDHLTLRSVAGRSRGLVDRLAMEAVQPLDRLSNEIARARAAWYADDVDCLTLVTAAEQRAAAMDANNRGLWAGEREQFTINALHALLKERPERLSTPLSQLDNFLFQSVLRPPSLMELMDEELMAFQVTATKRGAVIPALRMAPKPGARRGEVREA